MNTYKCFIPKLKKLDLTTQEAQIYLLLVKEGPQSANDIADKIHIFSNAVYRTTKRLSTKGFISILNTFPASYKAIDPRFILQITAKRKSDELIANAIETIKLLKGNNTLHKYHQLQFSPDKDKFYTIGKDIVDKARKEILIISIGETIPKELLLSMRKAKKRDVQIFMIVQKYDKNNIGVIENFKKNGYKIKYFPEKGFHLVVTDCRNLILGTTNPKNTNERISIQLLSRGLSKALRDYFYSVWEKAHRV